MSVAELRLAGNADSTARAADEIAYRPDVDGLRAVAALAVVAAHAGWLRGGGFGVDIFFVISGFLISSIIYRSLEEERFGFANFYARRIKRIFPALLLTLLATWAVGAIILDPRHYQFLGQDILAGAGFAENLWYYVTFAHREATPRNFLGHLWTLGIEEQFYLAWPLFLWLTWRVRRHRITLIAVVAAMSLCCYAYTILVDPFAAWFLPWNRLWELAAGALLACRLPDAIPHALRGYLAWIGAVLVVAALLGAAPFDRWPSGYAWVAVAGTLAIVAAGPQSWINRCLLAAPPLVFVGLMSYPLYLWHFPLFVLAALAYGRMPMVEYQQIPLLIKAAIVATSLALSYFTYICVERPLRTSPRTGRIAFILGAAMLACGVAAMYLTSR